MTRLGRIRLRLLLLLAGTTVLVLIACSVTTWVLPRPSAAAPPGPVAVGQNATVTASAWEAGDGPCNLIVGPARAYCEPQPGSPVASAESGSAQGLWLVGFSTAAIAAAVALAVTAGRGRG
ncbi:hypothetical protein [Streptomyces sp. NPDC026673]|uniref:hypothetical protein n=1 Tax=Streptomyces sp. NPDC026673 TaxID=3155724 RepID=UPI0033DBF6AE